MDKDQYLSTPSICVDHVVMNTRGLGPETGLIYILPGIIG
jgi:hypothetical protein